MFAFVRYCRNDGSIVRQCMSCLLTPRNLMTVRRKVLYNILVEFGIPVKLVKLIKMYLSEMYGKVHVSKCVSDTFPIHNCLKQRDA
jgi:hypothetical protein